MYCVSNDEYKSIRCLYFYDALHEKFKTETLLKAFKSTKPTQQLWRQGIGSKLLHMVQFISWVQVCNISIHLCATKTSLAFYQLLKFHTYDLPFDELPTDFKLHYKLKILEKLVQIMICIQYLFRIISYYRQYFRQRSSCKNRLIF